MFFSFEDLPEEIQQAIRGQQAHSEMSHNDFTHGVMRLFDELNQDQLSTLKEMLHILSHGANQLASHWEGMVAITRQTKYGVCAVHDKDHSTELLGDAPAAGEQVYVHPDSGRVSDSPPVRINDGQITPDSFNEEERALMVKYHLDDAYDEDTQEFLGFVCTGIEGSNGPCGMKYASIADRMLREPESCSGCFQRNAHG